MFSVPRPNHFLSSFACLVAVCSRFSGLSFVLRDASRRFACRRGGRCDCPVFQTVQCGTTAPKHCRGFSLGLLPRRRTSGLFLVVFAPRGRSPGLWWPHSWHVFFAQRLLKAHPLRVLFSPPLRSMLLGFGRLMLASNRFFRMSCWTSKCGVVGAASQLLDYIRYTRSASVAPKVDRRQQQQSMHCTGTACAREACADIHFGYACEHMGYSPVPRRLSHLVVQACEHMVMLPCMLASLKSP